MRALSKLLRRFALVFLGLIILGLGYDLATRPSYDPDSQGRKAPHTPQRPTTPFDGATFESESLAKKKPTDILKWSLNRQQGPWEKRPTQTATQLVEREWDDLRITFVNHSTLLIQTHGVNILTDPTWSEATGPFGRLGPKRFREPGIAFEQLPPIDAVFVSHSHYDHMDLPTLSRLNQSFQPTFIVGLGNAGNLAKVGIKRTSVEERNWWQSVELGNGLTLMVTPAQHWSKRSVLDTNRTLWASFVLKHRKEALVFFAGDTGYGPHFLEVAEETGPVSVALMPIGAYLPRWFMKDNHMMPSEAVKAAADLEADVMIPMHFGTFALGDDGQDEPLNDLLEAVNQSASQQLDIRVLDNGGHTVVAQP